MRSNTSNHRRARRAVLYGAALFVASQLALSVCIHGIAPESCDAEYALRIASYRRRVAQSPNALKVFVLGSSRTFFGLDGEEFERRLAKLTGEPVLVCNLGILGGGPVTHLLFTERLLADGIQPDLVIVEVTPGLLAGQVPMHDIDESRIPTKSLRPSEVELLTRYGQPERHVSNHQVWLANLVPCHSYRIELVNLVAPQLFRYDYQLTRNFDPYGGREYAVHCHDPARLLALQRANWTYYLKGFRVGERQTQAVRETIDRCQEVGVPIALLVTPEGPTFQSWYQPGDWEHVEVVIATIAGEEQVPLINGHDWLDEDEFVDSNHMHAHGARAFSLRLADSAWKPLHDRDRMAARPNNVGSPFRQVVHR